MHTNNVLATRWGLQRSCNPLYSLIHFATTILRTTSRSRPAFLPLSLLHRAHQLRGPLAELRHGEILIGETPGVMSGPMDVDRADSLLPGGHLARAYSLTPERSVGE